MRSTRAYQFRHPVLALLAGGVLLGTALRAATPVEPLPPPEPEWRKSAAFVPASVEPPRWFSAETYPSGAGGPPAWMAGLRSDGEPARYAVGYVPHPPEPLPPTSYDDAPRYAGPEPVAEALLGEEAPIVVTEAELAAAAGTAEY